jgi:alpha-glucosidase (family GH31 glycosyl hydrolase)
VYADANGNKDEGAVSVFARSGGAWALQKTLNISGGTAGDLFGYAVALSADGSTLAVGAISDDVNANVDQGSVSVFARTGSAWKEQQVITLDNGAASGNFGWSVSLSTDGNTLAAGGPNQGAGKAAVFTRSGGTWS